MPDLFLNVTFQPIHLFFVMFTYETTDIKEVYIIDSFTVKITSWVNTTSYICGPTFVKDSIKFQ